MFRKVIILYIVLLTQLFLAQSISLIDKYTKETFVYNSVDQWEDGKKMTDAKVDGVIYINKDNKYYRRYYDKALNAGWFGALPNDDLDDSESIQEAINYAVSTSQNLVFPFGRYNISKTIFIPQHFNFSMRNMVIDFSNSKLILNKDITLLQSDNWETKLDSKFTTGITIENFEIISEIGNLNSYAIKVQDYHQGTKLQNISSFYSKNLLHSINNYYLELYNINSLLNTKVREGKRFKFEGYHGLNKFTKLVAGNSDTCFSFENGLLAALSLETLSVEGCNTGIYFNSELAGVTIRSSYFENFNVALKFENYSNATLLEGNYFNFLNNDSVYLLEYKGLPLNNIKFGFSNAYIGTKFKNFIKNKDNSYGEGVIFELPKVTNDIMNNLNQNKGKNNKIIQLN
jgi:hypothetical protein